MFATLFRMSARWCACLLAAAGIFVLWLPETVAAQSERGATLTLDPNIGPPGQDFTIVGIGFSDCSQVRLQWDGDTPIPSPPHKSGVDTIEATFTVPLDEPAGVKAVEALCLLAEDDGDDVPATPTQEPTDVVDAPALRSAQTEVVAASAPFTVLAPSATPSDPSVTASPIESPSPTPEASPTPTLAPEIQGFTLTVDKSAVEPGGRVVVSGSGCNPDKSVRVALDGVRVATADVASDGSFSTPLVLPADAEIGRHVLAARCGPRGETRSLDVIVSEQNTTAPVAPIVTFALFLFAALEAKDFLEKERGERPPPAPRG